jgi:hypothetical protein
MRVRWTGDEIIGGLALYLTFQVKGKPNLALRYIVKKFELQKMIGGLTILFIL